MNLDDLSQHWQHNHHRFKVDYPEWERRTADLVSLFYSYNDVLRLRRDIPGNASFLLLAKAANHFFAMYSVLKSGLTIDAALCARNCYETLLLIDLCSLDLSGKLFDRWVDGEQFKPAWVRQKLESHEPVRVGDLSLFPSDKPDNMDRLIYSWLSQITHANRRSLEYTVRKDGRSFEVFIGGTLEDAQAMVNGLMASVSFALLNTISINAAVLNQAFIKSEWGKLGKLEAELKKTVILYLQSD